MMFFDGVDFEYGNTRLRARRADLLDGADYERLLGRDVSDLLAALDTTGHDAGEEPDGRQRGGLEPLHESIRDRLGRSLEEMRSFYSGRARRLVDLALTRFDLQNLIVMLRARSSAATTDEDVLRALAPVGWLTEALARQLLRPHELAGVVDLIARRMPDREQARALRTAFGDYERTDDLPALERAVVGEHAALLAGALARMGRAAGALGRFARREVDERNVLTALRLRDAVAFGAADAPAPADILRPGGSIPPAALVAAARAPSPDAVVAALGELGGGRWQAPLARWAATGDLGALQRAFERASLADAAALFTTGDPLSIDVPFAFAVAVQVEARNMRLLGEAAVLGIASETVRAELLWPGTQV